MAKNSLVEGSPDHGSSSLGDLVPWMTDAGQHLVEDLDNAGKNIHSALWYYMPDSESWRLLLATPEVKSAGTRTLYEWIDRRLETDPKRYGPLRLDHISVVDVDFPLVSVLRSAIQTSPTDVSNIRFTHNWINSEFIEDSLIYRST
jgi:hypothetical protein